jgi:hypothetical protein
MHGSMNINPLNAELIPICHLMALLGTRPILHIGRIKVKFSLVVFSPFWNLEPTTRF